MIAPQFYANLRCHLRNYSYVYREITRYNRKCTTREYNRYYIDNSKENLSSRSTERGANAMIFVVLCILILSRGHDAMASSRIEDVIVRFIVDGTPILFPPTKLFLQLCIDYGKTFLSLCSLYINCRLRKCDSSKFLTMINQN